MTIDELKQAHDQIPKDSPIDRARRALIQKEILAAKANEKEGDEE